MTLEDIYKETTAEEFRYAVILLVEAGFYNVKHMTPYGVSKFLENEKGIDPDGMELARKITQVAETSVELIQFCNHKKIFGEGKYKEKEQEPNFFITYNIGGKCTIGVYARNMKTAKELAEDYFFCSDIALGYDVRQMDPILITDDLGNILWRKRS